MPEVATELARVREGYESMEAQVLETRSQIEQAKYTHNTHTHKLGVSAWMDGSCCVMVGH